MTIQVNFVFIPGITATQIYVIVVNVIFAPDLPSQPPFGRPCINFFTLAFCTGPQPFLLLGCFAKS